MSLPALTDRTSTLCHSHTLMSFKPVTLLLWSSKVDELDKNNGLFLMEGDFCYTNKLWWIIIMTYKVEIMRETVIIEVSLNRQT